MTGHDYFRALLEVATVINSSLEPTVVLHKITEQTAKAMNPVEVAKSGLDGEVLKGKLIHLRDACSDGRFQYPESAKAEGLVSVLSAPLMVNGKAIGILRVYSSEERDFTPDECDFMLGVANISAIAIENARMHEATRLNYELLTSYNYQVFED